MLTIMYLLANTFLNFNFFTLKIRMSESAYMESLEMHERRKVVQRGFGGWPLTWLFLAKISVSLWLADFFSGVGEPATY